MYYPLFSFGGEYHWQRCDDDDGNGYSNNKTTATTTTAFAFSVSCINLCVAMSVCVAVLGSVAIRCFAALPNVPIVGWLVAVALLYTDTPVLRTIMMALRQ